MDKIGFAQSSRNAGFNSSSTRLQSVLVPKMKAAAEDHFLEIQDDIEGKLETCSWTQCLPSWSENL